MAKWFNDSQDRFDRVQRKDRDISRKNNRDVKEQSLFSALEDLANQHPERNEDSEY